MICNKCDELKHISDYYEGHLQCKDCVNQQKYTYGDWRGFLEESYKLGHYTKAEYKYAKQLLIMCGYREYQCKYDERYKNVTYDYNGYRDMYTNLITRQAERFTWSDLKKYYDEWIASGKNDEKIPTIDRIIEGGDYTNNNVQCLPQRENWDKAIRYYNAKPAMAIIVKDYEVVETLTFETLTACKQYFDNSNLKHDAPYLQKVKDGQVIIQTLDADKHEILMKQHKKKIDIKKPLHIVDSLENWNITDTLYIPIANIGAVAIDTDNQKLIYRYD